MRQKPPVEVFDAPTDVSGVSRDLSCKPGKEATRLGGRADPVSEMPVSRPRSALAIGRRSFPDGRSGGTSSPVGIDRTTAPGLIDPTTRNPALLTAAARRIRRILRCHGNCRFGPRWRTWCVRPWFG
jgi:hypothetical protein